MRQHRASVAMTASTDPVPGGTRVICDIRGIGTSRQPSTCPTGTPLTSKCRLSPWLACTSTPTVYVRSPRCTSRDAVPVPPLNP